MYVLWNHNNILIFLFILAIRVGFAPDEYTVQEENGFSVIMPVNVRLLDTGNDDVLEDPLFGSVSTFDGSARGKSC